MTIESPSGSHSWNLMEPDPGKWNVDLEHSKCQPLTSFFAGAFTNLCSEIGADKIQVEKLDISFDRNQLYNLRYSSR